MLIFLAPFECGAVRIDAGTDREVEAMRLYRLAPQNQLPGDKENRGRPEAEMKTSKSDLGGF